MKRRAFIKTSLAATALGGLTSIRLTAAPAGRPIGQDYYELRVYHLKDESTRPLLDEYLAKALIPGLNRLGVNPVGVFTEIEAKDKPAVFALIRYPSPQAFASAVTRLPNDPEYQKAGAAYLQTPKSNPAFERIDSWFLLAFDGLPKMELPAYCKEKKPRIFEIRIYESYSELKALKKVAMFNNGEIEVMREVGLGPIFFGQTLLGKDLPHLIYMLSAEDQEAHKKHWTGFRDHPVWNKLKAGPQYADTVSTITNYFLAPTPYSQI